MNNSEIAELLRSVAAAHQLKGANRFQIIAYETAADGIEHATTDIADIWKHGGTKALEEVPGVGKNIAAHLEELFKTGKVKHFESFLEDYPEGMFTLLKIPGIGPKTALKLVESGIDDFRDLRHKLQAGTLKEVVSEKLLAKLEEGVKEFLKRSDRMLLPEAQEIASQVLDYLLKAPFIKQAESLGSLRRAVCTVGDIDIAICAEDIEKVKDHVSKMPILRQVLEQGDASLTLILKNGIRVDVMVQPASSYGALLQHFTGSKHHNIKLRNYALKRGFSLSESGVKDLKKDIKLPIENESQIYELLDMQVPPPEIREDTGEIEAAIARQLPKLIELTDIKGDLHSHTSWSDGVNTVSEMAEKAISLGYEYMAITDHSYPNLDYSKRTKQIEQYNNSEKKIRVINGLEVNINASCELQISDKILSGHEFILASIHSSFRQDKDTITKRLVYALSHPLVNGIAHPTGRLLLERSGYDADWEQVFKAAIDNDKFLEINSFPDRMDLPDTLVRQAISKGVKLVIDTDSHHKDHMDLMKYGISVARRGWATSENILNTLPYEKFIKAANIRLH